MTMMYSSEEEEAKRGEGMVSPLFFLHVLLAVPGSTFFHRLSPFLFFFFQDTCGRKLKKIIMNCCSYKPTKRPAFQDLIPQLRECEALAESEAEASKPTIQDMPSSSEYSSSGELVGEIECPFALSPFPCAPLDRYIYLKEQALELIYMCNTIITIFPLLCEDKQSLESACEGDDSIHITIEEDSDEDNYRRDTSRSFDVPYPSLDTRAAGGKGGYY